MRNWWMRGALVACFAACSAFPSGEAPAQAFKQFVALAKARRGSLKFASGGSGSAGHLAGVLLGKIVGFEFLHVPYKGGPQAVTDLAAGQTDFTILSFTVTASLIKAGR